MNYPVSYYRARNQIQPNPDTLSNIEGMQQARLSTDLSRNNSLITGRRARFIKYASRRSLTIPRRERTGSRYSVDMSAGIHEVDTYHKPVDYNEEEARKAFQTLVGTSQLVYGWRDKRNQVVDQPTFDEFQNMFSGAGATEDHPIVLTDDEGVEEERVKTGVNNTGVETGVNPGVMSVSTKRWVRTGMRTGLNAVGGQSNKAYCSIQVMPRADDRIPDNVL